jgi:hypothetical protein
MKGVKMNTVDVTEEELCSFIESLAPKLRGIVVNIGKNKWDSSARHVIGKNMEKWFKEYFLSKKFPEPWENYFGYEGQNNKLQRVRIFSSRGCYPDMYFLKPVKIAIELDHERTGSALKNALTKAGFNKLSGDWNRVFVIFFDESNNKEIKTASKNDKRSQKVKNFYEEHLDTKIIVI